MRHIKQDPIIILFFLIYKPQMMIKESYVELVIISTYEVYILKRNGGSKEQQVSLGTFLHFYLELVVNMFYD